MISFCSIFCCWLSAHRFDNIVGVVVVAVWNPIPRGGLFAAPPEQTCCTKLQPGTPHAGLGLWLYYGRLIDFILFRSIRIKFYMSYTTPCSPALKRLRDSSLIMGIELPSLSRQVRAGGPSTGLEGTITRGSIYSVVEFWDCFFEVY